MLALVLDVQVKFNKCILQGCAKYAIIKLLHISATYSIISATCSIIIAMIDIIKTIE